MKNVDDFYLLIQFDIQLIDVFCVYVCVLPKGICEGDELIVLHIIVIKTCEGDDLFIILFNV